MFIEQPEDYVDASGVTRSRIVKTAAFPDIEPTELVLVERKREFADKDRTANQYLLDRIMGKPTERHEVDGELALTRVIDVDLGE